MYINRTVAILLSIAFIASSVMADPDEPQHFFTVPEGIQTEAALTLELFSNVDGGVERHTGLLGNLDLTAEIDTEQTGLWKNGRFFFYGLGNFGKSPTEYVGDFQATSNIEAPKTFKLYEAWYEHGFFNGSFSLLGGLHDYNSEFDALEYAGLFFNSSFGISPDISQVGPSIFPTTALALRAKKELENGLYLMGAAYDGIPGDPGEYRRTQIVLKKDDGIFYALEGGISSGDPETADYTKLAIGGWFHTATYDDFSGVERNNNHGIYAIGETALSERVGAFLQLGSAQDDRNQIDFYAGGGFNLKNIAREDDVLGLGIACARNSSRYISEAGPADRAETAIELTYQVAVLENVTLHPDLQYIINPGMDPVIDNALVLGFRLVGTY